MFEIKCIEMQARNTFCYKFFAHCSSLFNSIIDDASIIMFYRLKCLDNWARNTNTTKLSKFFKPGIVMYGHDSRNNGNINTYCGAFISEYQKFIHIIEKLSYNNV